MTPGNAALAILMDTVPSLVGAGRAIQFSRDSTLFVLGLAIISSVSQRDSAGNVLWGLLQSIRPGDWLKYTLVFAAILFSGKLFVLQALVATGGAFVALCLVASATYLVNDVKDRTSDRSHPTKCRRPIAAGLVPPRVAVIAAVAAGAAGIAIAFAVNRGTGLVVLGYLVLTTLYSFVLKHVVILDVLSIAIGFVLRVIAGAEAIRVDFSSWLVLCTFLAALFIGFGKRRHELVLLEADAQMHRPILREYSLHFLDMMMAVVTAATVMSYALYTMDPETVARFHSRRLIYTGIFVLYGIFRYLYLIHQRNGGGNPAELFYHDRFLLAAVLFWILSVAFLRYA